MRRLWSNLTQWFEETIHSPKRVLIFCAVAVSSGLIFDGTLIKIWRLQRNIRTLESKTARYQKDIELVQKQILRSNDPDFLEHQARERFDLVNEGDLVFVFSDPVNSSNE